MNRIFSVLIVATGLFGATVFAHSEGVLDSVKFTRNKSDTTRATGRIEFAKPADTVYRTLADTSGWSKIFSDIRAYQELSRKGSRSEAEVDSIIFTHPSKWKITKYPKKRSVSILSESHGVSATLTFVVTSTHAGHTRLEFVTQIKTSGFFGMLMPDASVRKLQQEFVVKYLGDARKHFEGK